MKKFKKIYPPSLRNVMNQVEKNEQMASEGQRKHPTFRAFREGLKHGANMDMKTYFLLNECKITFHTEKTIRVGPQVLQNDF